MQNTVSSTEAKPKKKSLKARMQKFGSFLSGMVMPNIGAFIAWGLITAIFIPGGWAPNAGLATMVKPMVTFLLPLMIGYTGGEIIAGHRGGVVGAIATMGVIVGTSTPMFIGAMIMGPLGGWLIKKWDDAVQPHIRQGFEMLVNNFAAGILGMILAILGFFIMGPIVAAASAIMGAGVNYIISVHLLPLANIFIEPAKILFLNNAINQGILTPLGLEAASHAGKSILFLLEPDPGPGLGVLLAFSIFGKGTAKASAPSAAIIHFFGGIHEIYFPYVLMKPALFLAVIAGGVTGTTVFSVMNVGLKATPSPGSIFTLLAMSPKSVSNFIGLILGVTLAAAASFIVSAIILRRDKTPDTDAASLEDATAQMSAMKSGDSSEASSENIENARDVVANYDNVKKIIFACDAGMGSSAMGASLLRDKVKKAGIDMSVTNTAINNLKDEPGLLVVTQDELADRAAQKAPNAMRIAVDNFLSSPKYDSIVLNLKARDQMDSSAAEPKPAPAAKSTPSGALDNIDFAKISEIDFLRDDDKVGTATMATSLMKDRVKKNSKAATVKSLGINDIEDDENRLVIVTPEAAKNLKTRYTNIQVFSTKDLLNSPDYDKMVSELK
ncbi:PTS mannitol transporter subunit IICBA [Pediococcus argentinicus]|uniref:PTS system mannitol-specific EIICB component n=1 Tax=Pediococcus argentinicus TaxID=480391 RepID=A0A0R2NM92_9LACO|nr:PTS mannitol transporter subunit IICBA [Pediococcus argentinicus]KRO25504.1 mtlA protein [Pediococcus argentinicus]NKZ22198.1 PTS mannitol transporter subunit IICBA [Pediococcus argentinicus]GEP19247.1 PTS mannitol transporter subunit IICB [Pediococcus argentinicus]